MIASLTEIVPINRSDWRQIAWLPKSMVQLHAAFTKEKYFGSQDEHFKSNYPNNNNNVKLVYQKTIILEPHGSIGENRKCCFDRDSTYAVTS